MLYYYIENYMYNICIIIDIQIHGIYILRKIQR